MSLSLSSFVLTAAGEIEAFMKPNSFNIHCLSFFSSFCPSLTLSPTWPLCSVFSFSSSYWLLLWFIWLKDNLSLPVTSLINSSSCTLHLIHQGKMSQWSVACLHCIMSCQQSLSSPLNQKSVAVSPYYSSDWNLRLKPSQVFCDLSRGDPEDEGN